MKKPKHQNISNQSTIETIDHNQKINDIRNDIYDNSPLVIELTWYEINRIAEILSGRFDAKTIRDVELCDLLKSYIKAIHERNLNKTIEIQQQREDFWDKSRKLLYSSKFCGVCGEQFCICG